MIDKGEILFKKAPDQLKNGEGRHEGNDGETDLIMGQKEDLLQVDPPWVDGREDLPGHRNCSEHMHLMPGIRILKACPFLAAKSNIDDG